MLALAPTNVYLYGAKDDDIPETIFDLATGFRFDIRIGKDKKTAGFVETEIFCNYAFADILNIEMNRTCVDFLGDADAIQKSTNVGLISIEYNTKYSTDMDQLRPVTVAILSDTQHVVLGEKDFEVSNPFDYFDGRSERRMFFTPYVSDIFTMKKVAESVIRMDGVYTKGDKLHYRPDTGPKTSITKNDFIAFRDWLDALLNILYKVGYPDINSQK